MSVSGSCACGCITFEASADVAEGTIRCNCTGCTKRGWWLVSVPGDGLRVTAGAEHVVVNDMLPGVERRSCGRCGVTLFYWISPPEYGGPRFSTNVRLLDGVDWDGLSVTWLDGLHDTWETIGSTVHREPPFLAASRG